MCAETLLPLGDVNAALVAGLGLLPEDRKRLGLVLSMNCREYLAGVPRPVGRLGLGEGRRGAGDGPEVR